MSLTQVHCKKWLATSFGVDLQCAVSHGRVMPPCHHVLLFIMKSLIGGTELVHTPNRLGDNVPSLYSARVDRQSTVSPIDYKIELSADGIPLPGNIYPGTFITLLYGNTCIGNLQNIASGERTSHRVNGIAIQANLIGPAPRRPIHDVSKYKRRSTGPTPEPACPQCWPQSWTIKNLTRDPKCRCKSFPILGDLNVQDWGISVSSQGWLPQDFLCNGGQKYITGLSDSWRMSVRPRCCLPAKVSFHG